MEWVVTGATHIAGAVFTMAVARGMGLEVGPLELITCMAGSLVPDIDTQNAGMGRFLRPVSGFLEKRIGHRTLTHSLLFLVALWLVLLPLSSVNPSSVTAFLIGVLSHILLDTANVNGVFLLWPARVQFVFLPIRSMRIKYGSPAEAYLAVVMLLLALVLYPVGKDGFDTTFRRFVASPETAVLDYLDFHPSNSVFVGLDGFNRLTQEKMSGNYRVIEALGRTGVLVEDDLGRAFQVSKNGQVVAYRVRAYRGARARMQEYRIELGGRTVRELLGALPRGARAIWITGELELGTAGHILPPEIGAFARLQGGTGGKRVTLHAARPVDLQTLESSYVIAGSAVVRAEFDPSSTAAATVDLPSLPTGEALIAHPVKIVGLASASGLLVQQGDKVLEGQVLARLVDDAGLRALEDKAGVQRSSARAKRAAMVQDTAGFRAARARAQSQLEQSKAAEGRMKYLVSQDAEPRVKLEAAKAQTQTLENDLNRLIFDHTTRQNQLEQGAQSLEVSAAMLGRQKATLEGKQLIHSPVAGTVEEIKLEDATGQGITATVVIVSRGGKQ